MATAEQLKRTKEGYMVKLAPVYGPLRKREGQKPVETAHWWAEVLGDYPVPALEAAADWWLHNDKTGYWPNTPAVVKDWLVENGYKPIPSRALPPPPTDPLAGLRGAANAFYTAYVVAIPAEVENDLALNLAWCFNRKQAFDNICRRFEQANPDAFKPLNVPEGHRPYWADVSALAVNHGALTFDAMRDEVLALKASADERKGMVHGGLAKPLAKAVADIQPSGALPSHP